MSNKNEDSPARSHKNYSVEDKQLVKKRLASFYPEVIKLAAELEREPVEIAKRLVMWIQEDEKNAKKELAIEKYYLLYCGMKHHSICNKTAFLAKCHKAFPDDSEEHTYTKQWRMSKRDWKEGRKLTS